MVRVRLNKEYYEYLNKSVEDSLRNQESSQSNTTERGTPPSTIPEDILSEKTVPSAIPKDVLPEKIVPSAIPEDVLPEKTVPSAIPEDVLPEKTAPSAIPEDVLPEKTDDIKFRRIRGILNKLTPETFDRLSDELVNVGLDSILILKGVILLIIEKAVQEPKYVCMYAQLCKKLSNKVPNFDPPNPDYTTTFRRLLLNKCQDEYENRARASAVFDQRTERLTPDEEEEKLLAKRKMLGNIKFIGELGKSEMLTHSILHKCCQELVKKTKAEDLECLCKIMSTCGNLLDNDKGKYLMDQYFSRMNQLSQIEKLPLRIRFMLQDVLELRENHWLPRQTISLKESPKPIQEIRREAYDELGVSDGTRSLQEDFRHLQIDPWSNPRWMCSKKHGTGLEDLFAPVPLAMNSLGTGPGVVTFRDRTMRADNYYHQSGNPQNYRSSYGMHSFNNNNNVGYGSHFMQSQSRRNSNYDHHGHQYNTPYNHYDHHGQQYNTPYNHYNHHGQQYNTPYNHYDHQGQQYNTPYNHYDHQGQQYNSQNNHYDHQGQQYNSQNNHWRNNHGNINTNGYDKAPVAPWFMQEGQNPQFNNMGHSAVMQMAPAYEELPLRPPPNSTMKIFPNNMKPNGPTRDDILKKSEDLIDEYLQHQYKHITTGLLIDMEIPDKFMIDVLTAVLNKALDQKESERELIYVLLMYAVKDEFASRAQLLEAFRSILDSMGDLEADVPHIKTYVAAFAALAISGYVFTLAEVAESVENGNHYPFLLLVLQQLIKVMDKRILCKMFDESKINLLNTLPEIDRTKDRMAEILEERELHFLFPLLKIQTEMAEQLQVS